MARSSVSVMRKCKAGLKRRIRSIYISVECDGRDFFCANVFSEFWDVGKGEFFKVDGRFADGGRVAVFRCFAPGLHGGVLRQGIENIGWRDAVLQMKRADGGVAVSLLVQCVQHQGNLVGGDGNTGQRCRLLYHLGCNFWKRWRGGAGRSRFRLRLGGDGIEGARQQR